MKRSGILFSFTERPGEREIFDPRHGKFPADIRLGRKGCDRNRSGGFITDADKPASERLATGSPRRIVARYCFFRLLASRRRKSRRLLGVSRQTLYDVLNGKQPITANLALRIGKLIGGGPDIWLQMQQNYDLDIAERATRQRTQAHPDLGSRGIAHAAMSCSPRVAFCCAARRKRAIANRRRRKWRRSELLFGAGAVSETAWRNFLGKEVTPRFPEGLTAFEGYGQWKAPAAKSRKSAHEFFLCGTRRMAKADTDIDAIRDAYKNSSTSFPSCVWTN